MTTTTERSTTSSTATGTARWARLASTALLLGAAAPLLMLAAAIAWGLEVGEDLAFFLVAAAIPAAAAALVRQHRTPMRTLSLVLALLGGAALFWTAFGLMEPASVFDFVPGLLVIPGALLGFGAGIAALRAQRRGDVTPAAEPSERRAIQTVLAVVVALSALSTVLTIAGRDTVAGDIEAAADVRLKDFEFAEDRYVVAGGDQLVIRNRDPFLHTFTIDALDIDVTLGPGSEKVVAIPDTASGTYVVYCEPHTSDPDDPSDDDMATTLVVS